MAPDKKSRRELPKWKREISELWLQTYVAFNRVLPLAVLAGFHFFLRWLVGKFVTGPRTLEYFEAITVIAFGLIYLDFGFELVGTFIPEVRSFRNRFAQAVPKPP